MTSPKPASPVKDTKPASPVKVTKPASPVRSASPAKDVKPSSPAKERHSMSIVQRSAEILNEQFNEFSEFNVGESSNLFDELGNYNLGKGSELEPNHFFDSYNNISNGAEISAESFEFLNAADQGFRNFSLGATPAVSRPQLDEVKEYQSVEKIASSHHSISEFIASHESLQPEQEIELEQVDPNIQRNEIIERIAIELERRESLKLSNSNIQQKLALFYRNKNQIKKSTTTTSTDLEKRYIVIIEQYTQQNELFEQVQSENDLALSELKVKTNAKFEECREKLAENVAYCARIAGAAVSGRTGKGIAVEVIHALNMVQSKKFTHVMEIRSENLKLRNKLRRQEIILKQKEELADGLHLIDFEQLKIENSTYSQKIQERNEDLTKLRLKLTLIVQVLSHVKEKIVCKQDENVRLQQELTAVDLELRKHRDALPARKQNLSQLHMKNVVMKEKAGMSGNTLLLRDYELRFDQCVESKKEVERLEETLGQVMHQLSKVRNKQDRLEIMEPALVKK